MQPKGDRLVGDRALGDLDQAVLVPGAIRRDPGPDKAWEPILLIVVLVGAARRAA